MNSNNITCHVRNFNFNSNPDQSNAGSDCKGSFDICKKLISCEHSCYLLWAQNGTRISAGCGIKPRDVNPNTPECHPDCSGKRRSANFYCCCTSDLCNYNYTVPDSLLPNTSTPIAPILAPDGNSTEPDPLGKEAPEVLVINPLWSLVPALFMIVVIGLYIYKFKRTKKETPVNNDDIQLNHQMMIPMLAKNQPDCYEQNNQNQDSERIDLNNVKLLEVIGQGRFGIVHRAHIEENESSETKKEVAVKVIKPQEHQSWLNERHIYNSPKIKHPNVLNCLYSRAHPETDSYWLIVEFASRGSLYCYMKDNPVGWEDFLNIALGVVQGLTHLHEVDVAHRDFKSKNVLLKPDLTPCITDFGVAIILDASNGSHFDYRKKYLQVGTPRYMAPEVLECSVTFTKSSFFKIDVYALSLVLWELLSRTILLPKVTEPSNHQQTPASLLSHPYSLPPPPAPYSNRASRSSPMQEEQQHLLMMNAPALLNNNNNSNSTQQSAADAQLKSPNSTAADDKVPPYKLPFEDISGPQPSIERMRQIVVVDKQRPLLRDEWRVHPTADICRAIEDGWEYDHDARISASCFLERVSNFVNEERTKLNKQ